MFNDHKISVIIPVFNEDNFIASVIDGIPEIVDFILVVNDASTDNTARVLDNLKTKPRASQLVVLNHSHNRGVGAAILTGYAHALSSNMVSSPNTHILAVMAGDGQMDPLDLPSLLEPIATKQADYVKGNRFHSRHNMRLIPIPRRYGIQFFTWMTHIAAGIRPGQFQDAQCGYTAANETFIKSLLTADIYPRYGFPNDVILHAIFNDFRLVETPVKAIYGAEVSGINPFKDVPKLLLRLLKQYLKQSFTLQYDHNKHNIFPAEKR